MSEIPIGELLLAAREGARHAFLTKPGGVRYGAAVWTSSGGVHRSGQYSSFNHSTNIHAEMGALAVATAAGDPDVRALLLVSTAATTEPARPCGVCRQVIAEHAKRVGRAITVIMASWDGSAIESMTSDELLPASWAGGSPQRGQPWIEPDPPSAQALSFGDQLVVAPETVGLVWAFDGRSGHAWVKVKYVGQSKLPHSYTQWADYQRELDRLGLGEPAAWGDRMVIVDARRCPRLPRIPVGAVGIDRSGARATIRAFSE